MNDDKTRPPRVARLFRLGLLAAVGVLLVAGIPFAWTQFAAAGHSYDESELAGSDAPYADVVLVLGAEVEGDGPKAFLRGRLDTAAQLITGGNAKVILVTGDAHGTSGDETAVMSRYLAESHGIATSRLVADPYGLDTYDSCVRARQVYGITRALVVTQAFHLSRAVALCRHAGIEADGVIARCDGCRSINLVRNGLRDYLACTKAAWDVISDRGPAVTSPPSTAVTDAVAEVARAD